MQNLLLKLPLSTKKKNDKLCTSICPLERDARLILYHKHLYLYLSFFKLSTAAAGSKEPEITKVRII